MRLHLLVLLASLLQTAGPSGAAPEDKLRFVRSIVVPAGAKTQDLICIYCNIRVDGEVDGDATTIGGNIEVSGHVKGDAVACGGRLVLRSTAVVDGDTVAMGGSVHAAPGVAAQGANESLPWMGIPGQRHWLSRGTFAVFVGQILLALLFYVFLRRSRTENISRAFRKRWAMSFLLGILVPVVIYALLSLTWHLGRWELRADAGLGILLMLLFLVGWTGLSLTAGRKLTLDSSSLRATFWGAILLSSLETIPVLGGILFLIASPCAVGAALISGMGSRGEPAREAAPSASG